MEGTRNTNAEDVLKTGKKKAAHLGELIPGLRMMMMSKPQGRDGNAHLSFEHDHKDRVRGREPQPLAVGGIGIVLGPLI
jgi:hypothetical protein